MTANNLFVQCEAATLIADRAVLGPDQRVRGTMAKFATSRRLGIAVAFSGLGTTKTARLITDHLDRQADQERAMGSMAALAAAIVRENARLLALGEFPSDELYQSPTRLAVAIWSRARDQAEGYALYTGERRLPAGVRVNHLVPLRRLVSPNLPDNDKAPTADSFDAKCDVVPLLDAQRRSPDWPYCAVGGAIDVVSVRRDRIDVRSLKPWKDKVGQLIDRPS